MALDHYTLQVSIPNAVDVTNGIIHGVAVITEGPAIGHGTTIDAKSLQSVLESAKTYSGGLKVKMEHGTGSSAIVGVLQKFAIDGAVLRADLKLFKKSAYYGLIVEMAQEAPESVGLSISFSGTNQKIEGVNYMRCSEIYSADIVDSPAANPNGLFERKPAIVMSTTTIVPPEPVTPKEVPTPEPEPVTTPADLQEQHEELSRVTLTALERIKALETELADEKTHRKTMFDAIQKVETTLTETLGVRVDELRQELASANVLASRKLASMGVKPGTVSPKDDPENPSSAKPNVIEQLNAITDPLEKNNFFKAHKKEIYDLYRAGK